MAKKNEKLKIKKKPLNCGKGLTYDPKTGKCVLSVKF